MPSDSSVYILIPVHNRKTTTIQCLTHLAVQGDLEKFQIVVIDDGSTDDTAAAIQATYSSVTVLQGNGNLWWTGAIKLGMEYAYAQGADFFIWLNDDTLPEPGAIATLVSKCAHNSPCAVAAQCYDNAFPTYGGQRKEGLSHSPLLPPKGGDAHCDSLSGNLTCIPRAAVERIGYPPAEKLPHYQGDTVYTWQLKQAGFQIIVTDQARAFCQKNPGSPSWLMADTSIGELWKSLGSPKSPFYAPGFWHFCIALWGPLGMLVFIRPYFRLALISLLKWTLPKALLQQLKTARP